MLVKIFYKNPRRPEEAGVRIISDPTKIAVEKETLEDDGFTVVEVIRFPASDAADD